MFRKLSMLVVFAILIAFGRGLSHRDASAQEQQTLRELADANDLYIGAAVYTSHLEDPLHAEILSREFNMLTPENEAKMCELQPQQGEYTFEKLDQLVEFAEAHDMVVRGHTLVWHTCMPAWLEFGDFTREEAIEILRDHITTVMTRYKGRIPMWDVVNEAVDDLGVDLRDTPWHRLIGDDYVDLAFQFAREADPDALLFYNDFNTDELNLKSNTVYAMIADMVERGVPIDGVGLQGHVTLGGVDEEKVAENIRRLGELGLEVHITEMDVVYTIDAADFVFKGQANDYRAMMDACLQNKGVCTTFVVWGVTDKFSWRRDPQWYNNPNVEPLLFDMNYAPKPAYFALLDTLASNAG
jgi:endo-1,4-beta-xylanase